MTTSLKNVLTLLFVGILYLSYSYFVLTPEKYNSFSLIDDGQTILNNSYFKDCLIGKGCSNLNGVLLEKEFGRFRPAYWTINFITYEFAGLNPILLHESRIYLIGLIIVLLIGAILIKTGGSITTVLISTVFFFTSYSFTENIIRLGPVEPYQLISIALMSYFYLFSSNSKWILITIFYFFALLIKETSVIALLPLVLVSWYFKDKDYKKTIYLFGAGITFFLITRYVAKPIDSSVAYVENFKFDIDLILKNFSQYFQLILNSTSPFIKIFTMATAIMVFVNKNIKFLIKKEIIYWLLVFVFFTGILIPWKYVLERYILVSMFSLSIVIGMITTQIQIFINYYLIKYKVKKVLYYSVNLILTILMINIVFMKFPTDYAKSINYRDWYSVYLRFEADQIAVIVNTGSSEIYIDAIESIDNWEVLYEIPIHIKHIHNRVLKVIRADTIPEKGYVFVRSPFLNSFSEEELVNNKFKILNRGAYSVSQIDPLKFRDKFRYRPITTLTDPPFANQKYEYVWNVYYKD